eukprot:CAMPEP_0170638012 /NCGR_PEP_ID=MMETSP0224-20130122/38772_1 /TAXON_ID=285029 /ORGANISM="Togula jolla, Strain CCCM 725" /LENGTH=56 /DNA_ID=CAMNT_0010968039 /DNA_START=171 /DNA_END=341 /DNA_ORIENTATION=-
MRRDRDRCGRGLSEKDSAIEIEQVYDRVDNLAQEAREILLVILHGNHVDHDGEELL